MATTRLTVAQATVRFLTQQVSERDGVEHRLFEGCFGIFGHGNVAGLGEALLELELDEPGSLTYRQARNEQGMVHAAAAFARMRNRLSTLVCTTSIGPGATNLVTGAALATINRLPVLLLPGDVFATRVASPVLRSSRTHAPTTSRSTTRSAPCHGSSTGSGGRNSCPRRCSAQCAC